MSKSQQTDCVFQTGYLLVHHSLLLLRKFRRNPQHTFLDCQLSSIFWTQVINWLNSVNFNIEILSNYDKMFGYIKERPHRTFLNHIIIIAKQVIYYNRRRKTKPLLCHLIAKLKFIEHVEYFIAKRKSRLGFNQQKRQIFYSKIYI